MNNRIKKRILIAALLLVIITLLMGYLIGYVILELPRWYVLVMTCFGEAAVMTGVLLAIWILQGKGTKS